MHANLVVSRLACILADMGEHWISSAEAIETLARRYDGSGRCADHEASLALAEDALLKRLVNSALRARASRGQMCWGDPLGDETVSNFDNECLPSSFWSSLSQCGDADRQIDWILGDFSFNSGTGQSCATGNAFDVHFEVGGIPGASRLQQVGGSQTAAQRGRPLKFDWVGAVLTIFGLIYRGELKPNEQADIERALIDHLSDGDNAPGEATARIYAKKIWLEYQKA